MQFWKSLVVYMGSMVPPVEGLECTSFHLKSSVSSNITKLIIGSPPWVGSWKTFFVLNILIHSWSVSTIPWGLFSRLGATVTHYPSYLRILSIFPNYKDMTILFYHEFHNSFPTNINQFSSFHVQTAAATQQLQARFRPKALIRPSWIPSRPGAALENGVVESTGTLMLGTGWW